ncbi:Predicted ATPase [Vibrio xiamenensis]|uniref:Predicted ATPase n=1 Tax=Vibrio xiamenensis TaxID=861298 RepID=A0A1G7Z6U7_9VIBR|nr:AAA family ATPase [Vibrio xiamenensis]SDH04325.1 Predicted ATPase [Vibrio xiamenensis]
MLDSSAQYVSEIKIRNTTELTNYPFDIPTIKSLDNLKFNKNVTFFIGENGTGKSTLLEAIAISLGFNPEGGTKGSLFSSKNTHSELHNYLNIIKTHNIAKDGYYLRAESFYNLASYMDEVDYLKGYGGKSLHKQSHGESFIATLVNKLQGRGIYLLDEPEAALSPSKQMAALSAIHNLVENDSQFIIATHSPILLAYPEATIISFDGNKIHEIDYEESDNYVITKNFINNYKKMLKLLIDN